MGSTSSSPNNNNKTSHQICDDSLNSDELLFFSKKGQDKDNCELKFIQETHNRSESNPILCNDSGSQTLDISYYPLSMKAKSINIQKMTIFCFLSYCFLCYFLLLSPTFQSIFVYLHLVKWPLGSLTKLERFALFQARNINIRTEDNLELYGWHLLNDPDHLQQAANLYVNNNEKKKHC